MGCREGDWGWAEMIKLYESNSRSSFISSSVIEHSYLMIQKLSLSAGSCDCVAVTTACMANNYLSHEQLKKI